ncbi:MAG: SDR family oxidoreductase [Sphingomonadales bacterium]|nr:SDR family oxidoreductase [Sphingomonadales bacterium]
MTEISGRVAVVTGSGSGIGRGLALELAAQGAAVGVADIIPENAEAVAQGIRERGGRAVAVHCDVIDRASVKAAKAAVEVALGPVSLVFANAGATSFERVVDMSEDDIDWIVHANFMGVMNCLIAFYPDMAARGDGHFFATASTAGLMPSWVPYHVPYSGAKLGVIGLMLNLVTEAAEAGIGVTVLCPGGVVSGMKANNARYRPTRFGGPGEGEVKIPDGFFQHAQLHFRPADEVAKMCLRAVRENRPMVVTDAGMRQTFHDTYVKLVDEAFDFTDRFEDDLQAGRV